MGVLMIRTLQVGVYVRATNFWKLPFRELLPEERIGEGFC